MTTTCAHCGKPPPPHQNYCDWGCVVASAEAGGGRKITPNGLPIRCVKADGTMLECDGGDHPTYLFPVVVENPDCENPEYARETHALIYSDGYVAVTLYECCYTLFDARDGKCLGGFSSKTARLSAEARAKIAALRPLEAPPSLDFVDTLLDCRRELAAKGVVVDYDAMMEEIDGPRGER